MPWKMYSLMNEFIHVDITKTYEAHPFLGFLGFNLVKIHAMENVLRIHRIYSPWPHQERMKHSLTPIERTLMSSDVTRSHKYLVVHDYRDILTII